MSRIKLSDGLVLSGYSNRKADPKAKQATAANSSAPPANDDLLNAALRSVVNAGCNVNSVQVELLKGALAGNICSIGLAITAEHILSTISNPHWIDREMMRQFFLEKVGFGSELSLRSGSACVEKGIPSPQRLAMLFHNGAHTANWLRLTEVEEMLLRIALAPFILEQGKHLSVRGVPDAVWVDVDTPDQPAVTSADGAEQCHDNDFTEGAESTYVKAYKLGTRCNFDYSDVYSASSTPHSRTEHCTAPPPPSTPIDHVLPRMDAQLFYPQYTSSVITDSNVTERPAGTAVINSFAEEPVSASVKYRSHTATSSTGSSPRSCESGSLSSEDSFLLVSGSSFEGGETDIRYPAISEKLRPRALRHPSVPSATPLSLQLPVDVHSEDECSSYGSYSLHSSSSSKELESSVHPAQQSTSAPCCSRAASLTASLTASPLGSSQTSSAPDCARDHRWYGHVQHLLRSAAEQALHEVPIPMRIAEEY